MRFFYTYTISVMLFASCRGKQENVIPQNILPEKKMVEVLVDMHLVEGMYAVTNRHDDTVVVNTLSSYDSLYKRHGLTQEEFRKSLDFYGRDPDLMLKIIEKVTDSLNVMNAM